MITRKQCKSCGQIYPIGPTECIGCGAVGHKLVQLSEAEDTWPRRSYEPYANAKNVPWGAIVVLVALVVFGILTHWGLR